MTNRELAEKLRCISSVTPEARSCETCSFWMKEALPQDLADAGFPEDFLCQCDVDRVGMEAADALENSETHVLALQKEIEKLRKQVEIVQAERDAVHKHTMKLLIERKPQWVSVKERLPEPGVPVLVCDYGGHIETGERSKRGWLGGWIDECAAYWTPLPEPPQR